MDRFTTKENPKPELLNCVYCLEHSNCYSNMSCPEIYNALSKLRYYENLEEQERLIILPFKFGTKVYVVEDNGYWCDVPCGHEGECEYCDTDCPFYDQEYIVEKVVSPRIINSYLDVQLVEGKLGKTVFLNREEAEAAIRGK